MYQDDVKLFMRLGGQEYPEKLTVLASPHYGFAVMDAAEELESQAYQWSKTSPSPVSLSTRLLAEEISETFCAMYNDDIEEIADGLVDIVYIVMGIANRYGIDFDACWREVHSANLAKFPEGKAELDSAGEIIKPPNWTPPNIFRALGIE